MRSRWIGLLLAVVMALTSQAMAIARAAPGPSGMIELCTGTGPVMVTVDDQGQPIGHPHLCPDYAAHAFDLGGVTAVAATLTLRAVALAHRETPQSLTSQTRLQAKARGPPLSA